MIEARVKELRTENEDSDWVDRKWNGDRRFKVIINDRKNCSYGLNISRNMNCFYSDGSVRDGRTALGIHNPRRFINISKRMNDDATIMQAELMGICISVDTCNRFEVENEDVVILTDSQAALRALEHYSNLL